MHPVFGQSFNHKLAYKLREPQAFRRDAAKAVELLSHYFLATFADPTLLPEIRRLPSLGGH